MKHQKIYAKTRQLIDERELNEDNLDLAHEELVEVIETDERCDWAFGLLSEIYYWSGENDVEDRLFYFEEGVKYGEQGVDVNENSLESNFWLSVNYGAVGQEKGIMKSLSLITPMKELSERVIEVDESYFYGGPWRVLGRLYNKAPGFPISIGSNKKATECLERALEFGPDFYLNHLFLAELYISDRKNEQAREHLEWVINAPLNKNHEREDEGFKGQAEALLESLKGA